MNVKDFNSVGHVRDDSSTSSGDCESIKPEVSSYWTSILKGISAFERRVSKLIGRPFEQSFFVSDDRIYYGSDERGPSSMFGVCRIAPVPGSWTVVSDDERDLEGQECAPVDRFEDAFKQMLACVIRRIFSQSDSWYSSGRMGIFWDRVPGEVERITLTPSLARRIYKIDEGWKDERRAAAILRLAEAGVEVLYRSTSDTDAWIDEFVGRSVTPEAVWGFNISIEEFVDLAFDWALSPTPLGGTPMSELKPGR